MGVLTVVILSLLQHDLLHRIQVVSGNLSLGLVDVLHHQVLSNLLLVRIRRSLGRDEEYGLRTHRADLTTASHIVGSTLLLTDGTQVDAGEYTGGSIEQHLVLKRISHLVVLPNLSGGSLWCLHLLLETVVYPTLKEGADLLGSDGLASRQRGDVLFDERTDGLFVEVTDDGIGKLTAVLIELLQYLEGTLVVELSNILSLWDTIEQIAAVSGALERILIDQLGVQALVLQHCLHLVDE